MQEQTRKQNVFFILSFSLLSRKIMSFSSLIKIQEPSSNIFRETNAIKRICIKETLRQHKIIKPHRAKQNFSFTVRKRFVGLSGLVEVEQFIEWNSFGLNILFE
jgi:hypothetical protein